MHTNSLHRLEEGLFGQPIQQSLLHRVLRALEQQPYLSKIEMPIALPFNGTFASLANLTVTNLTRTSSLSLPEAPNLKSLSLMSERRLPRRPSKPSLPTHTDLSRYPMLSSLSIRGFSNIGSESFLHLPTGLKILIISRSTVKSLDMFTNIEELHVRSTCITPGRSTMLPQLKILKICDEVPHACTWYSFSIPRISMPRLETLSIDFGSQREVRELPPGWHEWGLEVNDLVSFSLEADSCSTPDVWRRFSAANKAIKNLTMWKHEDSVPVRLLAAS